MNMFIIFAYLLFILDTIIREVLRSKIGAKRFGLQRFDNKSSYFIVGFLSFVLILPFFSITSVGTFENFFVQSLGIVLQMVGLGVRIVAMVTLGKYFTGVLQVVPKHELITRGIYRTVRHPGYLAVFLLSVGFGLAVGNWLVLFLIFVAYAFIYHHRIRSEEVMLQKEFGTKYTSYMKNSYHLIPFIY